MTTVIICTLIFCALAIVATAIQILLVVENQKNLEERLEDIEDVLTDDTDEDSPYQDF